VSVCAAAGRVQQPQEASLTTNTWCVRACVRHRAVTKLSLLPAVLPPLEPAATPALQQQLKAARARAGLWASIVEVCGLLAKARWPRRAPVSVPLCWPPRANLRANVLCACVRACLRVAPARDGTAGMGAPPAGGAGAAGCAARARTKLAACWRQGDAGAAGGGCAGGGGGQQHLLVLGPDALTPDPVLVHALACLLTLCRHASH
jgi:hypothetical protein